jgi:hypothetical protein
MQIATDNYNCVVSLVPTHQQRDYSLLQEGYPYHSTSTMTNENLRTMLMLSLQGALVGQVGENLFAVTAGYEGKLIRIIAYFEGEVGDDEIETISAVGGEVIADFSSDYSIEESCLSLNEHKLKMLDFWAFMRKSYEDKM